MRTIFLPILLAITFCAKAQSPVLFDLNPGSAHSHPVPVGVVNNNLIVSTRLSSFHNALFKTDGSQVGTQVLRDYVAYTGDSYSTNRILVNNKLVFGGDLADDWEPWVTDGTTNGTEELK